MDLRDYNIGLYGERPVKILLFEVGCKYCGEKVERVQITRIAVCFPCKNKKKEERRIKRLSEKK